MAGKNPDIAAFTTPMGIVAKAHGTDKREPVPGKYKEFLDAIHHVLFSGENIDMETEIQWDNLVGQVMGVILTEDFLSGTMFVPIRNRMFRFKSIDQQLEEVFVKKFTEELKHHPMLIPAVTAGRQKINELMVSFQRAGRTEQVEMVRSFQVQMQDSSKTDDALKLRR
jgi:hypothetical protein